VTEKSRQPPSKMTFPKYRLAYIALDDYSFWQNALGELQRNLMQTPAFTPVNDAIHLYFFGPLETERSCWVAREVVGQVPDYVLDELPFSIQDLERGPGQRVSGEFGNPNLRHLLEEYENTSNQLNAQGIQLANVWRVIISQKPPFQYQLDVFWEDSAAGSGCD
jgi:hypothetical protein